MSQRNNAYAKRMKRLKIKTKRQRAKSNQLKKKKNMPEIFNAVTNFTCAETRSKCRAYLRIVYILKMYNNFLTSFTETYYEQLLSSNTFYSYQSRLSQQLSPVPISPTASSNYSPTGSANLSPFGSPRSSKSATSPFDIVTKKNLKPSKNVKKKKSNSTKKKCKDDKKSDKENTDDNKYGQFRRKKKKSDRKLNGKIRAKSPTTRRKPAKSAAGQMGSALQLKGGFYDLYVKKCGEYNNIHLVNDFNHICEKHDLVDMVKETKQRLSDHNKCDLNKCISLNRMYRDRLKCCKYNKFRQGLYLGFAQDQNETITQQLMDKIHNYMLHTFDIGIQLNANDLKTSDEKTSVHVDSGDAKGNNDYKDDKLYKINDVISKKRDVLFSLTNTNKWFTKFTSIIDQNYNDMNNINANNYGANQGHYSPRYYYWSVYSDWDGSDKSNPGYNYMDWYIEPKYNSLKHELLSGQNRFLSKYQWQNLVSLCNVYKLSNVIKMIKADFDDLHGYGIKRYTPIQTQHLLSIIIYCNFEAVRNRFVQTFVRVPAQESDDHLKERHARFGHLARLLRESVEVFGQRTLFSRVKKFYHCLDKELMLKETSGYFNMPISTSIHYETVINLNKKSGVILELADQNDTHLNGGLRYFDTSLITDFTYEFECLFISSLSPIHIQTIIQCNLSHNYKYFIHSLNILYLLFKGKRYKNILADNNDQMYKKCAAKLIQHQLFKNSVAHNKRQYIKYPNLPKYIENLLHYFFLNTNNVIIHFEHLCDMKQFQLFDQLFIENINQKKYIKLNVMLTLFPNITNITINAIKGRLEFDDDHIFPNILKLLSTRGQNVYLQEVVFKEAFPNSMCTSIQKYESQFIQNRWLITQQLATLIFKQSTFDVV